MVDYLNPQEFNHFTVETIIFVNTIQAIQASTGPNHENKSIYLYFVHLYYLYMVFFCIKISKLKFDWEKKLNKRRKKKSE